MLVRLKSNGREIEIKKEVFDTFSFDQKRNYDVIDATDKIEKPVKTLENTIEKETKPKAEKPETK